MNDVELDERISAALVALADQAEAPRPYPGVPSATGLDRKGPDRPRPSRVWIVAAAVVGLALASGVALSVGRSGGTHDVETVDGADTATFGDWSPGWHDLDTSGLPDLSGLSVAFLGEELYLAGTNHPAGPEQAHVELYRFDPVSKRWSEVPAPAMERATIVAAGEQLVARGARAAESPSDLADPGEWATWVPGDASWTDRGDIAASAALQRIASTPLRDTRLVWTGRRVIDVTHGSVLDPLAGTSWSLELPPAVDTTALVETTTPVWTGSLVVMTAWSSRSGVTWDADGRLVGLLPPPPDVPTIADATWVAATDEGVIALAAGDETGATRSVRLDPTTGSWTRLDDLPPTRIPAGTRCSYVAARAADQVVAAPCTAAEPASTATFTLDGDRWQPTATTRAALDCCPMISTSGPDAAAFFSEDTPRSWIAVWIPDGRASRPDPAVTTLTSEVERLLVADADGRLGTWDGTTFDPRWSVGTIDELVTTRDGDTAIFTSPGPDGGCLGTTVYSLDLTDQDATPVRVLTNAHHVLVDPTGQWVAYRYCGDGTGPGISSLTDPANNWRVDPTRDGIPLTWQAGGQRLLFGFQGTNRTTTATQFDSGPGWTEAEPSSQTTPSGAVMATTIDDEIVVAVGSQLRTADNDTLIDLNQKGAQLITQLTALGNVGTSVLATTRQGDGTIAAWTIDLSGGFATVKPFALPGGPRAVAPATYE